MSPIESAGRSQAAAPYSRIDDPTFDPAAVLLALSAQQFGIMQNTLANQITGARSQVGKIAEMGSTALAVSRLRENVIGSEAATVEQVLAEAKSFGAKYAGGEQSSLTVSAADNERLKQLEVWADERGFTLAGMTRLEQPSEEAVQAAVDAGVDPPEPRLVADEAAVKQNLVSIQTYLSDVRLGVADNPAIRGLMANSAGAAGVLAKVREFGYSGDVDSLADLEAASSGLEQAALAAVATLAHSTDAVKRLAESIAAKAGDFESLLKEIDVKPHAQDEAARLKAELKRAELLKVLQEILQEHAETLAAAEGIGMAAKMSPEIASTLFANLSDAEKTQFQADQAKWQSDFNAATAVEETRPGHNSLAEMRRNYL